MAIGAIGPFAALMRVLRAIKSAHRRYIDVVREAAQGATAAFALLEVPAHLAQQRRLSRQPRDGPAQLEKPWGAA